ncbi:ABC transporter ATP-binding protein [Citrifermentans bremense]|uniref:ABC transporter ATP-binding protein n=1 Tax=Citrifermentans bremense TaxID=60035 RepID=UPI000403A9DF|nr:ABC transporter ATP-binding protein [Citrifermentans bremense]
MSDTVIEVENLWKEYRLGSISHHSLSRDLQSWWARLRRREDPNAPLYAGSTACAGGSGCDRFWALREVAFRVEQGEVLGIVGRNGAGKSTLLKILSQVTAPSRGEVRFKGRIASLLEVGTGFHPELSGRENVFLNGAILGMSKADIRSRLDEIIAFAEIEKFIDTPVKRYSSGMYVRLAFAVAAHLEPEILIVDEVLAVGDAMFQKKCLGKMQAVGRQGRTVLFVSHQMDMVRALCNRCLVLDAGRIAFEGESGAAIEQYLNAVGTRPDSISFQQEEDPSLKLQIVSGRVVNQNGEPTGSFDVFDPICLEFEYRVFQELSDVVVNFELKRNGATLFLSFDTDTVLDRRASRPKGLYRSRIKLPSPLFKSGSYSITTSTGIVNTCTYQRLEDVLAFGVELHSRPSSLLSYADKRPGVIAVPLEWTTEMIKEPV